MHLFMRGVINLFYSYGSLNEKSLGTANIIYCISYRNKDNFFLTKIFKFIHIYLLLNIVYVHVCKSHIIIIIN